MLQLLSEFDQELKNFSRNNILVSNWDCTAVLTELARY